MIFFPPDILERAEKIRLLAMDVDGVLTPGTVTYLSNGEEVKTFNVKDGHGLSVLNHLGKSIGFHTAFITGRTSPITEKRGEELGITYVYQGIKTKLPILDQLAETLSLDYSQIAYIGDDLPDLPILEKVGLSCCPQDAVPEILSACNLIIPASGGNGAVRIVCDLLMHQLGLEFKP
jgi:3-deoxy-D-manno-octulosonate 8-phosphate phosphatase (KDO 8-P phosphatase)